MVITPYAAALRIAWRRWSAQRRAGRASHADGAPWDLPPAFILGCACPQLMTLGRLLATHPQAHAKIDPSHAWAAIDERTDTANLYGQTQGMVLMDTRHASSRARTRFNRLFFAGRADTLIVEVTPNNVCRIGFLEGLAPSARYLHIVPSGLDATRFIGAIADTKPLKIAGRSGFNPWWGADDAKWAALARDGAGAGYFAAEIGLLETHAQRAAYEWLVSLAEADRWRFKLGARFSEITTNDLATKPLPTLTAVCTHLGLAAEPGWLTDAAADLVRQLVAEGEPLRLPPRMAAAFNAQQERFGFPGRADLLNP
jgi:hypothetical protein